MRRFRLLQYYVATVVAVIGMAVAGISMKRTMATPGTQPAPESSLVYERP
jgi:hypothetical protein